MIIDRSVGCVLTTAGSIITADGQFTHMGDNSSPLMDGVKADIQLDNGDISGTVQIGDKVAGTNGPVNIQEVQDAAGREEPARPKLRARPPLLPRVRGVPLPRFPILSAIIVGMRNGNGDGD